MYEARQVRFSSRQFTCPLVRVVRRNFDSYHVDSIGQPSEVASFRRGGGGGRGGGGYSH